MQKAIAAIVAAGLTAPLLATNGQIVTNPDPYLNQLSHYLSRPMSSSLSQWEFASLLQQPEKIFAWMQQNAPGLNLDSQPAFDGFSASSVPYAGNAAYFSGYSSGEVDDLYEEAYPGFHTFMANYRQPVDNSPADSGWGGGLQGFGGGLDLSGKLGGLIGHNPGYTSQAEFNRIVFD